MICRYASIDDTDAIIDIVTKVYGCNYWHMQMYEREYVSAMIQGGSATVILAAYDNAPVSMLIVEEDTRFCGTLLLRSLMTVNDNRYDGSAQLLLNFLFDTYDYSHNQSMYLYPVTGHKVSQHIAYKYGFVVCGALMNAYNGSKTYFITNADKELLPKRTNLLATRRIAATNVGTIYLPNELRNAGDKIYSQCGVSYRIISESSSPSICQAEGLSSVGDCGVSSIDTYSYYHRNNTDIIVRRGASDCLSRINAIIKTHAGSDLDTYQVYINILYDTALEIIPQLISNGYRFTGFKPMGKGEEYAIFYYSQYIAADFASCELTELNLETVSIIEASWSTYE